VDNRQHNASVAEVCDDEDSMVDISSGIHEVVLQQDSVQESQHLVGQMRVREDMIVENLRHIDDTHMLVVEYFWRAMMEHDSLYGDFSIEDFQTLKERVTMVRTNYQQLLIDRDYLLDIGEMYHWVLKEKKTKVDQLTHELVSVDIISNLSQEYNITKERETQNGCVKTLEDMSDQNNI
jgi:hypothetical protein